MFQDVATVPKLTMDVRAVQFMSQRARWPVEVFCRKNPDLSFPLKSLEPTMFQDVATVPKLTFDVRVVPFISQMRRSPVEVFCQRMSDLASPS